MSGLPRELSDLIASGRRWSMGIDLALNCGH